MIQRHFLIFIIKQTLLINLVRAHGDQGYFLIFKGNLKYPPPQSYELCFCAILKELLGGKRYEIYDFS